MINSVSHPIPNFFAVVLHFEVMELCGGELADLSQLELLKRDDLKFQVLDDEDYSDDISNELSELDNFDDDDEDYY